MSVSESKMALKLLIDVGNDKVLFAEAEKDFVDFMFSLLVLPLGSIIKLITPRNTLGSIGKLYQSVENISEIYLVANFDKLTLLQPTVSALAGASPLLLPRIVATSQPNKIGYCSYCEGEVIISDQHTCSYCETSIRCPRGKNSGTGNEGADVGFLKGPMTYMITDDLEITPMSAISSINLLNRFKNKKNVRLEEKAVVVGVEEGIALLMASLQSSTALTDVFLNSSTKKAVGTQSNVEEIFERIV